MAKVKRNEYSAGTWLEHFRVDPKQTAEDEDNLVDGVMEGIR